MNRTNTIETIREGDKVVTCARKGSKQWSVRRKGQTIRGPLWCVATYIAKRRQQDGLLTWRLHDRDGSYSVEATADKAAEEAAEAMGLPFEYFIRHGQEVYQPPPPPPANDLHEWCYGEVA